MDLFTSKYLTGEILTFDLQNLIRSSVGLVDIQELSLRLLKLFVRYRGNKICPDKWMNAADGRTDTAATHNAFADNVG